MDVQTTGSVLNQLQKAGLKWEPKMKERLEQYTAERFRDLIGLRRTNIEALQLHAQAVGESLPHDQMCLYCQQGHGIDNACIVVPEPHDVINARVCQLPPIMGNRARDKVSSETVRYTMTDVETLGRICSTRAILAPQYELEFFRIPY